MPAGLTEAATVTRTVLVTGTMKLLESKPQFARFLLRASAPLQYYMIRGPNLKWNSPLTRDQILLMQDTIIDVRRRTVTEELTISEIVSREIDPVLFILPRMLTTEQFPTSGLMVNCLRRVLRI